MIDHEKGDSVQSETRLAWKVTTNAIDHKKDDSIESGSRKISWKNFVSRYFGTKNETYTLINMVS